MASRARSLDQAATRGRELTANILRELREGRLDRNLSGSQVADALGISASQYSRIERGLTGGLTIEQAAVLLAAVGLDLSARAYPGGEPMRDVAHAALIDRLRQEAHPTVRFATEVPFPESSDRRAWDVVLVGRGWRHGVEAETRPRDLQALERRISLKVRDGAVDAASLLLLDSRHNRAFIRAHGAALQTRFPVDAREALRRIRAGVDPGEGSVLLL